MREIAQKAFDSSTKENDLDEGAVPEKDKTDKGEEAPKSEEGKEGEVAEPPEKVEPTEADKDAALPFHDHPRWKEVVKQRDEFKGKVADFETKLKEVEPLAKNWKIVEDYRTTNNISQQDFNEGMTFLAALKSDPKAARAMLKPVWDSLEQFDGDAIPTDLQARVTEGEISEAAAKEMAGLRAQKAVAQTTGRVSQEQSQQAVTKQLNEQVQSWQTSKTASDPAFKPKVEGKQDGLYELTAQKAAFLMHTQPPKSVADYIKHMETAYAESKTFLKQFVTAKPATPVRPSSSSASSAKPGAPKTIREVVVAEAAKAGLSMSS